MIFVTYGDGVGDVDITALLRFHESYGKLATMTAVFPPGRYGALELNADGAVKAFREKPAGDGGMINGGYFVFEPEVFDRIIGDESILEEDVLPALAAEGQLTAYEHGGFWRPMDTLRDRRQLEAIWASGDAPWKTWSD